MLFRKRKRRQFYHKTSVSLRSYEIH